MVVNGEVSGTACPYARVLHFALNRQSKLTALMQIEERGVWLHVLPKLILYVVSGLGLTH
jgi:hypothetical protein